MRRLIFLLSLLVIATGCAAFDYAQPQAATPAEPLREEVAKDVGGDFSAKVPTVDVAATRAVVPGFVLDGINTGNTRAESNVVRARATIAQPPPTPPKQPQAHDPKPAPVQHEAVAQRGPMLIYTAEIAMAVFEVNVQLGRVEQIARDLGGFMAKRADRSITIRVPASKFDEAVRRVEGVGDVIARNVTAQDITEEFHDLELRLKNARATQARLLELLAKASKVDEAVLVERELDRVSSEVERIEGRIKLLRDRAAFSTITVSFQAKPVESVSSKVRLPAPWLYNLGLTRLLTL